jgi:hypothetical protein
MGQQAGDGFFIALVASVQERAECQAADTNGGFGQEGAAIEVEVVFQQFLFHAPRF